MIELIDIKYRLVIFLPIRRLYFTLNCDWNNKTLGLWDFSQIRQAQARLTTF